jgi:error-prone DNA polymerase
MVVCWTLIEAPPVITAFAEGSPAKAAGLAYALGARLCLADGSEYLAWPTSRRGYGRLTRLLSLARMSAPKDAPLIARADMIASAQDWVVAAVPPAEAGQAFAERFGQDAAALPGLLCAAPALLDGRDQARLAALAQGESGADPALREIVEAIATRAAVEAARRGS